MRLLRSHGHFKWDCVDGHFLTFALSPLQWSSASKLIDIARRYILRGNHSKVNVIKSAAVLNYFRSVIQCEILLVCSIGTTSVLLRPIKCNNFEKSHDDTPLIDPDSLISENEGVQLRYTDWLRSWFTMNLDVIGRQIMSQESFIILSVIR